MMLVLVIAQAIAGLSPRALCLEGGVCREASSVEQAVGPCATEDRCAGLGPAAWRDAEAPDGRAPCADECGCCLTLAGESSDRVVWPARVLPSGLPGLAPPAWIGWATGFGLERQAGATRVFEPPCRGVEASLRSTRLLI